MEDPKLATPQGDHKPETDILNPALVKEAFFRKRIIEQVGEEKYLDLMRKVLEALPLSEWPTSQ